jgi:DNA modification methylase
MDFINNIFQGDCLEILKMIPDCSVDCCITSPPYYGLRDYGVDGQIGLEETPEEYITRLVNVFHEVKRVIKDDGTLWVNIGDSYCGTGSKGDYKDPKYAEGRNGQVVSLTQKVEGCKSKDLIGIPWMLAFALRNDGWYLRQDIIWQKPNPMPESVRDRCTKSHEYLFLLSKKQTYYFDYQAIQEVAQHQDVERLKNIKFGGEKYGENEDHHFNTYS